MGNSLKKNHTPSPSHYDGIRAVYAVLGKVFACMPGSCHARGAVVCGPFPVVYEPMIIEFLSWVDRWFPNIETEISDHLTDPVGLRVITARWICKEGNKS